MNSDGEVPSGERCFGSAGWWKHYFFTLFLTASSPQIFPSPHPHVPMWTDFPRNNLLLSYWMWLNERGVLWVRELTWGVGRDWDVGRHNGMRDGGGRPSLLVVIGCWSTLAASLISVLISRLLLLQLAEMVEKSMAQLLSNSKYHFPGICK